MTEPSSDEQHDPDRPVLELSDIETIEERRANAIAREGYRTVWEVYQASETELSNDVDELNIAQVGYLKSGIGDLDPESYLYRPHFAPDEDRPNPVPLFDPVTEGWKGLSESHHPDPADSAPTEHAPTETEGVEPDTSKANTEVTAEDETAESSDSAARLNWETDSSATVLDSDPLVRLPTRLSSMAAILVAVVVSALIAVPVGLAGAFAAGLGSAALFTLTFLALTSEKPQYVVAGSLLLVVSSIAFLGSIGLAVRLSSGTLPTLASVALILGLSTVTLDLTVGLRSAVRKRVKSSLLTISLALPLAGIVTLSLDSPLVYELLTAGVAAVERFLQSSSTGVAPFGVLLGELAFVIVGFGLLRARVPAAVVPPVFQILFTDGRSRFVEAIGSRLWYVLIFGLYPLAVLISSVGLTVETPTGVTGYGPTVATLSEAVFQMAWGIGRTVLYHWLLLGILSVLCLVPILAAIRKYILLDSNRRPVFVSILGYVSVLFVISVGAPVVVSQLETTLAQLAEQQAFARTVYGLYRLLGPVTLLLAGSYLGVVVIALLLYAVYLLELFNVVPNDTSGLALGCGFVLLAAIALGLIDAAASPLIMFVAIAGVFYIWDLGQYAAALGSRLGRHTETKEVELVHSVGGFVAAGLAAGLAYGGYRVTTGVQFSGSTPQLLLGLVFSIGGMITLLFSLRD
ncbi:DUF7519 family protein [Halorientalis pallida]|uniref:Uncharacterized protein n=1 Tax=Halorientalis pallida TaxID=2479928 RepID=A0A498KTZ5_9EURY|nr:hypothetical protein [Halorientalis pallida]RXK47805.1 hypothetical protein EAF64_14230 [Halorientalis pallida]